MGRIAILGLTLVLVFAAQAQTPAPEAPITLAPMKKAATADQIHEYLQISNDVETYRERWIALVDAKRAGGKPYWPEAFWTSVEDEMRSTDLTPTFVMILQHSISKKLMTQVLKACRRHTTEECHLSPEFKELFEAEQAATPDVDRMQRARTNEIIRRVFAIYKPQIEAARAQYATDHPDWNDQ